MPPNAMCLPSLSLLVALFFAPAAAVGEDHWPQWRGPDGTGVARGGAPCVWSDDTNVKWIATIPGRGHSTPVIWRERIFLTTAVPFGEASEPKYSGASGAHDNLPVTRRFKFIALAVDRRDGRIVWQRTLNEQRPHEGGHYTASQASASPATDGEHLFAPVLAV